MKEKSCGAVVYKIENEKVLFLILKHNAGHFSFPKGHMEPLESEVDTAIREIKEETNIDVEIDESFRMVNTYSPKEGIIKDVIFFLGKCCSNEIVAQTSEISEIFWYDFDSSKNVITFENDRIILEKAYKYIVDNILK